jgi:hypothetical protein
MVQSYEREEAMMAENKTKATAASVDDFIASVERTKRREDAAALKAMFERLTGMDAKMWGPSIIGFGSYDYVYDSGHSGTAMITGFSPRKANLVLYIMPGFERSKGLMAKLGKYKTGRSCLYINKLEDIDLAILETLILDAVAFMKEKYPTAD